MEKRKLIKSVMEVTRISPRIIYVGLVLSEKVATANSVYGLTKER